MASKYYGAAAEYNKPSGFRFTRRLIMIVLLVIGGIILLSIGLIFIRSLADGPKTEMTTLVLRHQRLQQFVSAQQGSIKNSDLAKINSDANILLASDGVSLRKQYVAKFGALEFPENIQQAEADSTSSKRLKDADLVSRFDETYVQILQSKIAATQSLAQDQAANYGGQLKTALQSVIANLNNIDSQLEQLNL